MLSDLRTRGVRFLLIVQGEPEGIGRGVLDAVAAVGGDEKRIAGGECEGLAGFELENGLAAKQQRPWSGTTQVPYASTQEHDTWQVSFPAGSPHPHPFQRRVQIGFPESNRPADFEVWDQAGHAPAVEVAFAQLGGRLLFRGHGLESITPGRTDPAESAMVNKSETVANTVANKRPFIGKSVESGGASWKPTLTSIPSKLAWNQGRSRVCNESRWSDSN